MSVLSYLQRRSSEAVLSSDEKSSITTSIVTLQSRLAAHFNSGEVIEHFKFGSSTRDTILPRSMDDHSDIDYMVVFRDAGLTPQGYLDRLKRFVENKYTTSEIYQSAPTITLELNHIKFELVPALKGLWSGYKIPNVSGGWQDTNPNDFNTALTSKNSDTGHIFKPVIRLMKLWNAKNNYVFDSYSLEKWMVDQYYFFCTNQRDYLFSTIDKLSIAGDTQWRKDKIERAKKIVADVRSYESNDMPTSAEIEVKKLIPE